MTKAARGTIGAVLASAIVALAWAHDDGRPLHPAPTPHVAHAAGGGEPGKAVSTGVYDPDPQHLWNRLHDALFVRIGNNGETYGRDRVEPLLWRGSRHLLHGASHDRLIGVLAEFNEGGESLVDDPVRRAMLQRDVWLVFSWLESSHNEFHDFGGTPDEWRARQERLRKPLAQAIGRLALTPPEIAALPDTYAAAVASGQFASRFDPKEPDQTYLPADLFAADSPWVSLGRKGDLIARAHVLSDNPFTNSAFLVFIKLPAGRAATRAYVERLSAFKGPLFVGTASSPTPEPPNFNPAIPQFPAGTEVALVRRALLVSSTLEVMPSPVVEGVQIRFYRQVPVWKPGLLSGLTDEAGRSWQSSFEFLVSRTRLFAGQSGGLRPVGRDERDFLTGFSTHGIDPFEPRPGEPLAVTAARPMASLAAAAAQQRRRSRTLTFCTACHFLPGVYSFNTFTQNFPGEAGGASAPLSAMPVRDVLRSAVTWKLQRADWQLLQRLLRRAAG